MLNVRLGQTTKDIHERETFTALTGINQVLILGNTFRENSCMLFLNGILMEKTVDYIEATNRKSITVLINLEDTDKIEVRYVIE